MKTRVRQARGRRCRIVVAGALALVLAASGAFLAGCAGADSAKRQSVAVVVQNTANSPHRTGVFASDLVKSAQKTHGYVDVIVCDGEPASSIGCGAIVGSDATSGTRVELENEAQHGRIMAAIDATCAQAGEVDILAALEYAARSLASAPPDSEKVIAISSSGLSTAGIVNFCESEGMVAAQANQVAEYYAGKGLLPDLSIVDAVVWSGMGDVAGDQPEPDPSVERNLREIWGAILSACGVDTVRFDDSLSVSSTEAAGLPAVSVVALPPAPAFPSSGAALAGSAVVLDDLTLRFVPGTADFQDPPAAGEILGAYAEAMQAEPLVTLTCYGSTAGYPWDEAYSQSLSEARAGAVRDFLVSHGVSPSRIAVVGYADKAPEHVPDIDDETGLQIPDKAAQNRWVKLAFSA